jgi:hypothetical protein
LIAATNNPNRRIRTSIHRAANSNEMVSASVASPTTEAGAVNEQLLDLRNLRRQSLKLIQGVSRTKGYPKKRSIPKGYKSALFRTDSYRFAASRGQTADTILRRFIFHP